MPKSEKGVSMRRRTTRYGSWAGAGTLLIGLWLVLAGLDAASAETLSEPPQDLAECAKIEDDAERLKCYDHLAGREPKTIEPPEETAEKAPEKREEASYFSRLWDLDEEGLRRKFAIKSHRSNYFLPYTYNSSPNMEVLREDDPDKTVKKAEAVFQLSLKAKLWKDVLGQKMDLWFGYTQRSFWQLYNSEDSAYFRETDYEPELLINFRTDFRILGLTSRFINLGFNHQSNGQSNPLSRSWNRVVANFGLERGRFSLLLKTWYRIPESAKNDDNPNIEKFLGYGELWAYYFWKKHRLGLMLRNNFSFHTNRGALQAEWSFPIYEWVNGYVQYFVGYGESLLDYNRAVNRIGIGFIIADWN